METTRKDMSEEEKNEYLENDRKHKETTRKNMTDAEREAEKFKSRQRYDKNSDYYKERYDLNASIRKHLKFHGDRNLIKEALGNAVGGRAESFVEAEKLVNISLNHRQSVVNSIANSFTNFVYTLKKCKAKCDEKDEQTAKFVAMMGASLHTNMTESYFIDTTYNRMSDGVYALNENGLIMDLFEQLTVGGKAILSKWECPKMCNIDEDTLYRRFYHIIEEVLESTPEELIHFVERIDCSPRIARWNSVLRENEENDNNECNIDSSLKTPLGHPHACYIHYPGSYGCTSILLFSRYFMAHYPFIRNIVNSLYKMRKRECSNNSMHFMYEIVFER